MLKFLKTEPLTTSYDGPHDYKKSIKKEDILRSIGTMRHNDKETIKPKSFNLLQRNENKLPRKKKTTPKISENKTCVPTHFPTITTRCFKPVR